jgi:large subunit GTPase 1
MEDQEFEVHRPGHDDPYLVTPSDTFRTQELQLQNFDFSHLTFPKKPFWNKSMSAEEVDRNERNAFLDWRRKLAIVESSNNFDVKLTPYEKNLDVWRQLWRVSERSDILLQVCFSRLILIILY